MPYAKGDGPSVVIALGGNALGNSPQEQLELVKNTAKHIVDMIADGVNVVVSHGNGPQVGMINKLSPTPPPTTARPRRCLSPRPAQCPRATSAISCPRPS